MLWSLNIQSKLSKCLKRANQLNSMPTISVNLANPNRRNLSLVARERRNPHGPSPKKCKKMKKRQKSMNLLNSLMTSIMNNTWKITKLDKLSRSSRTVWTRSNKTMTGNKILLMNGTKLLRKRRNRKSNKSRRPLIRGVSIRISLEHLKDLMPPIGAESLLKRRKIARLNLNGTNPLFQVPVES